MQNVCSKLMISVLGLTLAGSACKSAVYDNAPTAISSASPAPTGSINTTSVVNGAITPEKLSLAYLPLAGGTMTGTLTLAGAPTGANDAATKAYVDSAIASAVSKTYVDTQTASAITSAIAVSSPPGSVISFAGSSAPTGWLLCDGSAVSRTTYSALFTAIGIAHGQGDGSTTFNLPDYRGRFIRMVDGTAGVDPNKATRTAMSAGGNTGNNVGSLQTDAFQGHYHDLYADYASYSGVLGGIIVSRDSPAAGSATFNGGSASTIKSDGSNGTPRITSETRPTNAYANFIIKQ